MYLGKDLSPQDYYQKYSLEYINPHAQGIEIVIKKYLDSLQESILDMGCGPGLATQILLTTKYDDITGLDSSPEMVERYIKETKHPAIIGNFWDPLPQANVAIFCYSLHLCQPSYSAMVRYRLLEAKIKTILVISPFKERADKLWPSYVCINQTNDKVGPDNKTIYGRLYHEKK